MIKYDSVKKLFHLSNAWLSCVLAWFDDEEGKSELILPYIGAPLSDPASAIDFSLWKEGASFDSVRQALPYACPVEGRGDYRPSMVCAMAASKAPTTELFFTGKYEIIPGKPALPGLPATYTESPDEAETLALYLADPLTGLEARLLYTIFADYPAITCSVELKNGGSEPLTLENAGSFCLSLPGRYDLIHLHGAWAKERQIERVPAASLVRMIESARGASGHEHNPFAALVSPDADEFSGECYGVNLVYSGSFRISADENAYASTRLVAGINPRTFSWLLAPGESFQTPEAVCVYSPCGLNAMSQTFHKLYRTRLCRGEWRDRPRPVLINNWEATYFNFDHDKLMKIARTAADVGVELFVLDDGWFGHRDIDNCSLGDWVTDLRKLPRGLKALGEDINRLGLRFGLWFEPEMVSPDSDLYRAHPDWCLHVDGRRRSLSRHQLILDMSRTDVQDYVIEAVSSVLRDAPIGYVKWDMNRNFKEAGSDLLFGRQTELSHRYMLGLYRVMEAVTSAFPQVLFESCSGGGGRFDAGILYYMPQTWTSDDTDAIERIAIQYGTSVCYPCSAMGAHVSAVPNHQLGRITPMKTRGDVALGGNFGYELDLSQQTPEDLEEIRRQVAQIKKIRSTTQRGTFTRLLSPFEGNVAAWQFADEERAVLCVYRTLAKPNPTPIRVRMRGLDPDARYTAEDGRIFTGRDLMNTGVTPALPGGDFASCVMVFDVCR